MTGPGVVLTEDEYVQVEQALAASCRAFGDIAELTEVPERSGAWQLACLVGAARDVLRTARARANGGAE